MIPTLTEVRELFETLCRVDIDPKLELLGMNKGEPEFMRKAEGEANATTMQLARNVRDSGLKMCQSYFEHVAAAMGPLLDDPRGEETGEVDDEPAPAKGPSLFDSIPPAVPMDFAESLANLGLMLQDLHTLFGADVRLGMRMRTTVDGQPAYDVLADGTYYDLDEIKKAIAESKAPKAGPPESNAQHKE